MPSLQILDSKKKVLQRWWLVKEENRNTEKPKIINQLILALFASHFISDLVFVFSSICCIDKPRLIC